MDSGSWTQGPGSWVKDLGQRIKDLGYTLMNPRSRILQEQMTLLPQQEFSNHRPCKLLKAQMYRIYKKMNKIVNPGGVKKHVASNPAGGSNTNSTFRGLYF